jgi:hypothetical protein
VLRYLPTVIAIGLLVYCLLDCLQTPQASVRTLPKLAWVVVILIVPVLGPVCWLLAGRAAGPSRSGGQPPRRGPQGPDDDPDFLRGLDRPPKA